jgi:quinol monooxygenase YgiN
VSDLPVVAVIVAKPGSEDAVRAALQALVAPTLAESGCRSYTLHESVAQPGTFITLESWGGPGDLDAHMASPHIAAALAATEGHLAVAPAIHPLTPA